ncbi:MAG: FapA family protein [Candidatus Desantisbacteria bacterium]
MARLYDVDAHFKLETDGHNLYLTVHPPAGEGKWIGLDDVLEEIRDIPNISIDLNLVSQIVNDSTGIPIKIGKMHQGSEEGKVLIEVTYDELRAYLTLPGNVPLDMIEHTLRERGVVVNIDEHAIINALQQQLYNTPILIAQATMPVSGEDSVVEFNFEKTKQIHLKEKDDGRVDFRELGIIDVVHAGDVLAVKSRPNNGVAGVTVTGREIPSRDGIDKNLPSGRNTELSNDGLSLKAAIDGQVVWKNNRIHVESVLEVKGDVDYSVGNIDFPGSIIIRGNVLDGFMVKSTGNIEVQGCIEKAYVSADGNILVDGGIIGKGDGNVRAKGTIWANFIEHGIVDAGEDIIVNESIRYSQVDAKKRIIVQGKIGAILGGRIRAGEEVNAKIIGTLTEAKTEIEVGALPLIREEIYRLKQELADDEERFHGIEQGIKFLLNLKQKLGDSFPEEKERLLIQHIEAKNMLKEKIYTMSMSLPALESDILQTRHGKVCVYKVVHPGTRITIRNSTFVVKEEYPYVTFASHSSGKIETLPFEEPVGITMVKDIPIKEKRSIATIPFESLPKDEMKKGKEKGKKREREEKKREEKEEEKSFEAEEIVKPLPLEVEEVTKPPVIARLKIRMIADPIAGVLVSKIKVGDWVTCKIIDITEIKHIRDQIRMKQGNLIEGKVEEIFDMDMSHSKVIVSLGQGIQGETVVANSSRIRSSRQTIPSLIVGILMGILTFIFLSWVLWWVFNW